MSLYTRARNHFDMRRIKELNENKIIKQIAADREHLEGSTKSENKFNWRKDLLREFGEWAPIEGSGPTNSTSTTFGYFAGGSPIINGETGQQVTFTYSGLDGVENYPTSVTIDQGGGDTFQTSPPPFSAIGVQGYTAKLNPRYEEAQKKYKAEMKEWERKKEQQQKDIEATLKSFGTSFRGVQQKGGGITKVGNSYVAIIPTNTRDFGSNLLNNVRVVRLVPCDPSQPMELTRNVKDISGTKAWNVTNAQYSDDVYLQIGEQPKEPMESQYLMPRRNDFKDINPQIDASQEFAQKVGADYMMNARVQDTSPTPAYYPTDQSTVPGMVWIDNPMSASGGYWDYDSSKMGKEIAKVASVGLTQQDQEWLNGKQSLVNKLKIAQKFGGPAVDFAQWAINWAKGDYTPIKEFSPQMRNDVLDQITRTLTNRPRTSGAVRYGDYTTFTNNSTRLGLGRFTFDIGPNGVKVKDNFDVDLGGAHVGGALHMIPGLQDDANKITELGNRVGGGKGKIPIDVTIPWSEVSLQLQNRLDPTATIIPTVKRKKKFVSGRVSESTWDKLKKHQ